MRHTALTSLQYMGRTPEEIMTGHTPNISPYIIFDWYQTIEYHVGPGSSADFPQERSKLGKWVGLAHNIGQALCYYILTEKGTVLSWSTVVHPHPDYKATPQYIAAEQMLIAGINLHIGDNVKMDSLNPDFV